MLSSATPSGLVRGISLRYAPWAAKARRDTAFVAAGAALYLPVLPVALTLLRTGGSGTAPMWVAVKVLVVVVLVAGLPLVVEQLTAAQRMRFRGMLGVVIARTARPGGRRLSWDGLRASWRSADTWRQLAYHLLAAPAGLVVALVTVAAWAAGTGLATILLYGWALTGSMHGRIIRDCFLTVAGVLLLLVAPRIAAAAVRLDTSAARVCLGPGNAEELRRRVEDLTGSRTALVDAADAERRRIERDLHDGAQERLTSLAIKLGMARATLTDLPEARRALAEAHEGAKEALAELRNLVRGLHPAVLDDRGLDAALSGVAARAPLPVQLRVTMPQRAAPTVEAVAYFVASEALTNIARHAQASRAEITVERAAGMLRLVVTDDGRGGADPSAGTGLAGLARRVASVDGSLRIDSPAGGPTSIVVELPCVP